MIWHICPECKEILSGDELRGSNRACKACSMRKDRSDLIEIDSEHPEESQGEQNTKAYRAHSGDLLGELNTERG